jgi:hypothetical protein
MLLIMAHDEGHMWLITLDLNRLVFVCHFWILLFLIVCKHLFFSLEVRSLLVGAHVREDFLLRNGSLIFVRGLSYLYVRHNC